LPRWVLLRRRLPLLRGLRRGRLRGSANGRVQPPRSATRPRRTRSSNIRRYRRRRRCLPPPRQRGLPGAATLRASSRSRLSASSSRALQWSPCLQLYRSRRWSMTPSQISRTWTILRVPTWWVALAVQLQQVRQRRSLASCTAVRTTKERRPASPSPSASRSLHALRSHLNRSRNRRKLRAPCAGQGTLSFASSPFALSRKCIRNPRAPRAALAYVLAECFLKF
jgi:hypothetical protein